MPTVTAADALAIEQQSATGDQIPAPATLGMERDGPLFRALSGARYLAGLRNSPGVVAKSSQLATPSDWVGAAWCMRNEILMAHLRLEPERLHHPSLTSWTKQGSAPDWFAVRWQSNVWLLAGAASLARGEAAGSTVPGLKRAAALAKEANAPDELIMAEALLAQVYGSAFEAIHATRHARTASRMSRVEARPQMEYFSNLVLARTRRIGGRPYLAALILRALRNYASAAWFPALAYESLLCGISIDIKPVDARIDAVLTQLSSILDETYGGTERRATMALDSAGLSPVGNAHPIVREYKDVCVALGAPTHAGSTEMKEWAEGTRQEIPWGLHQLAARPVGPRADAGPYAVVRARHGERARRVLTCPPRGSAPPHEARFVKRKRSTAAVAALLLADAPIETVPFFETLYGMPFEPARHRAILNTLIYDTRAMLEGTPLKLIRDEESFSLEVAGPVFFPDSRCSTPIEEKLFHVLSQLDRPSATTVSNKVGIPLRTTQRALRALVEAGVCESDKLGREVVYRVVDTTFSEPTGVGSGVRAKSVPPPGAT